MCVNPIQVVVKSGETAVFNKSLPRPDYAYSVAQVPCGKCIECLKHKRRIFSARVANMCKKNPLVHFVTLTYAEKNLPIAVSLRCTSFDEETGEEVVTYSPTDLLYSDDEQVRMSLALLPRGSKPRIHVVPHPANDFLADSGVRYDYVYSPSLRRKDVRDWIKRNRMRFERDDKRLNFSYTFIGEMGPNTARPHYHLLFFGLTREQVNIFCKDWQDVFGFTYIEQVRATLVDHCKVGNYIGKYMSKHSLAECKTVVDGICEKPRLCQSKGFGSFITEDLRKWYLGFDVVGEYDPNSLARLDGSRLSQSELDTLTEVIGRRQYVELNGKKFPLSNSLKLGIYGYFDKTKGQVVRSAVFRLAMDVARSEHLARDASRIKEISGQVQDFSGRAACLDYSQRMAISVLQAEVATQKDIRELHRNSKF